MFIIPNSNKWSCLPASFAMACGVSFEKFISLLGHNGDSYPYENKSHRRGFHIQECIDVAFSLGFVCMPIERYPAIAYSYATINKPIPVFFGGSDEGNLARFMQYMQYTKRGVLEGIRIRPSGEKMGHACAWDGEKVYDPSHRVYNFEECVENNFVIVSLWILTEVQHGKT